MARKTLEYPSTNYTVSETAALLKVHEQTIRSHVRNGEIAAFRVGRAVRIPAEEIDRITSTPAAA